MGNLSDDREKWREVGGAAQGTSAEARGGEDRQFHDSPGAVAATRGESAVAGDDSIGADRELRTTRRFNATRGSGRVTSTGGILRQLIAEYRDQREAKLAEVARLDVRIEEFENLLDELEQRVRDNPRSPDE
jgi:hypothetical protein